MAPAFDRMVVLSVGQAHLGEDREPVLLRHVAVQLEQTHILGQAADLRVGRGMDQIAKS